MKDRAPLYPGRVVLTPVPGHPNKYDMTRADEPTEAGTPLSKANLLKDETAIAIGGDTHTVPDEAFSLLNRLVRKAQQSSTFSIGVYTKSVSGDPISGCVISTPELAPVMTSSDGFASVAYKTPGNVVVTCITPIDYGLVTMTQTVDCSDAKYKEITFNIAEYSAAYVDIKQSGTFAISGRVDTFDISCQGAGGGGGAWHTSEGYSSGGGGGGLSVAPNLQNTGKLITVVIGAGGAGQWTGGTASGAGGSTSVYVGGTLIKTAGGGGGGQGAYGAYAKPGGVGGSGDVVGPRGAGSAGAVQNGNYRFNDPTSVRIGGGGGYCIWSNSGNLTGYPGGTPDGGNGGSPNNAPKDAINGGGGGGRINSGAAYGGKGGDGVVSIRWRLK